VTPPPLLLTRNSELRGDGIWNWTLPAWVVQLADGRSFNVCPSAGACAKVCYARNGTYLFPAVRAAHMDNLRAAFHPSFPERMLNELTRTRYAPAGRPHLPGLPRTHLHPHVARLLDLGAPLVRVHDSGDFFSASYLDAWLTIARAAPGILFYAYTKEVRLLEETRPAAPPNLLWIYSLGGRQDHLVDRDTMRHADVFPTPAAVTAAGYYDQTPHDLLAVVAPALRIGIPANNIPAFRKRQGGSTFAELEAALPRRRTA
jgi:hypothetical protein